MNELLVVSGCFLGLGLLLGWLAGHATGIETERARQIDKLTKPS